MAKSEVEKVPHSWELKNWPSSVWPHKLEAVRWLINSKRDELTRAGVLVRPGRTLVVIGAQYLSWLQRQSGRVDNFEHTNAATAARVAKRKGEAVAA